MSIVASARLSPPPRKSVRQDFGDWQTPRALVVAVLDRLRADGHRWDRVLEPTCGQGHWLEVLGQEPNPPTELMGVEIQAAHAAIARDIVGTHGQILTADLFQLDLGRDLPWRTDGKLLVVGNPPWVTVAALGKSGGTEHNPGPERISTGRMSGLDALTGKSNFDLAEAVWRKLIHELASQEPTIALLCKASVARALLRAVATEDLPIRAATFHQINSARWFDAAVSAGLLQIEVGLGPKVTSIPIYEDLAAREPSTTWALRAGSILADQAAYDRSNWADGVSPIAWRQGVKHDAAAVMELIPQTDGGWRNGLNEPVEVEADRVYPWFKATDLARGISPEPRRAVVISQRALGDDPAELARTHPRLWAYLQNHAAHFARRKSSIYRGRPPFALFGIGPYTFSPYKVAISGLHKAFRFRALGPVDGRPPLVDDTGYFIPCPTAEAACTLAAALNGPETADLLRSLTFADSKRPITQAVLKRIDVRALLDRADPAGLRQRAEAACRDLATSSNEKPASWRLVWQDDWTQSA